MYTVPAQAQMGLVDVSRTLAYLDSMRTWSARGHKRPRVAPEHDLVDPRHLD